MEFNFSFRDVTVDTYNESRCLAFMQPHRQCDDYIRFTVNRDSSLVMDNTFPYTLKIEGQFIPRYQAFKSGHLVFADEVGGVGLYPEKGLVDYELTDTTSDCWRGSYDLAKYGFVYLSVFPPRAFNMEQYFRDHIYMRWYRHYDEKEMTYPYPSDEEIEEAALYANTVLLFPLMWKGRLTGNGKPIRCEADNYTDASYSISWFEPTDPAFVEALVGKAIQYKVKFFLDSVGNKSERERIIKEKYFPKLKEEYEKSGKTTFC